MRSMDTKSFCIDARELCTRYTVDVIASCAYGLEANSLKYPNGDFVTYAKKIYLIRYVLNEREQSGKKRQDLIGRWRKSMKNGQGFLYGKKIYFTTLIWLA